MNVSSAASEPAALPRRWPAVLQWWRRGINLPLALGVLALGAYALGASPYELRLLTIAGIYAIMVIGFQFIFGYAGAVSLAQSCFFGVGAYVTAVLATRYGCSALVTFPLSIACPVLLAAIIAVPVLRLEDHYFALATLAVTLLVELILTQWQDVTGGNNGLAGIPAFQALGWQIASRFDMLVLVWSMLAVAALLAAQIRSGLYGRSFHLMRESAPVAAALGLDVARMRFVALLLSAAYAGAAGALIAHLIHVVSPEAVGLRLMITCLTMTVVGGRLSTAGAIAGALLITHLQQWFRPLENYTQIAYGGVTLAFLIAAPYGLLGALQAVRARLLPETPPPLPVPLPLPPRAAFTTTAPLLSISDVSKSFGGVQALDRVSFDIRAGEIVGLIGPNGSGKTTLLNVISGLERADAGSIALAGRPITELPAFRIARLGVARTFQHIHLVGELSLLDNVAIGRAVREKAGLWTSLRRFGRDDGLHAAQRVAAAAADRLGIAAHAAVPAGSLPYGTRRRVEVARALATEPSLLLLDEPAAGLNEEEQQDLAARVRSIARDGVTVLVIEHNMVFLAALAERLICLDQGHVIAAGSPEAVRGDPRVIDAYLGVA